MLCTHNFVARTHFSWLTLVLCASTPTALLRNFVSTNPTASAKPHHKVGFCFFAVVFGALHPQLCCTNPLLLADACFMCKHTNCATTKLCFYESHRFRQTPSLGGVLFCKKRKPTHLSGLLCLLFCLFMITEYRILCC